MSASLSRSLVVALLCALPAVAQAGLCRWISSILGSPAPWPKLDYGEPLGKLTRKEAKELLDDSQRFIGHAMTHDVRLYGDVWETRATRKRFLTDLETYLLTLAAKNPAMKRYDALREAITGVRAWIYMEYFPEKREPESERARWRRFVSSARPVPEGWQFDFRDHPNYIMYDF